LQSAFDAAGELDGGAGAAIDFGDGAEKLFVLSDGSDAGIYHWEDSGDAGGTVEAGELTLVGTLDGLAASGASFNFDVASMTADNFVIA
ncbi:MAG: hypothetical protein GVY22_19040, partial [Gammaproteobacteria bacterium]|jgi:hypothetical protein|nr:hypothetical protein [Gammaproteobacteria bacterium]